MIEIDFEFEAAHREERLKIEKSIRNMFEECDLVINNSRSALIVNLLERSAEVTLAEPINGYPIGQLADLGSFGSDFKVTADYDGHLVVKFKID